MIVLKLNFDSYKHYIRGDLSYFLVDGIGEKSVALLGFFLVKTLINFDVCLITALVDGFLFFYVATT